MVRALRAVIGKQWRIQRRVVNRALLGPNQSERSKFFVDQSESSIYPTWLMWRHNAHIWAWKFTWPHGEKNTQRQSWIRIFHIVLMTHAQFGPRRLLCAVTWMGLLAHAQTAQIVPRSPAFVWAYFRVDLLRMRKPWKEAPDPSLHWKPMKKHTV